MQEEVSKKTVNLAITTTKLTIHAIIRGLRAYIHYRNHKKMHDPYKHGKQTVKELIKQGQGASSMVISDKSLKDFEKIARKYGVDYAITKDKTTDPPNYVIFFKARDADALQLIVNEYGDRIMSRQDKPSVLEKLAQLKSFVAEHYKKAREKTKELIR